MAEQQVLQQLQLLKLQLAERQAVWQAAAAASAELKDQLERTILKRDRRGPPKPPPHRRIDAARDSEDYMQAMAAQEAARGAYDAAWRAYRCTCDVIDGLFQSLSLLFRDEEVAREAADAAEDAYLKYVNAESEKAELEAENLRLKVAVLELQEREANAPKRAELCAAAQKAWGPDHASRPPTAVYDLRGPLQPVPPPEQHANGSWIGGRIPVVTAKQA